MQIRSLIGSLVVGAVALGPLSSTQGATKPEYGYLTNSLNLPLTASEANLYSRDIDGDGDKENALGNAIAAMNGAGALDLATATNDAVDAGSIVMLHSLRTFSLANSRNATWQVWYGKPTIDPPAFDGTDVFPLLAGQPHSTKLEARIKDHRVTTVAGKIPVRLDLGAGRFLLDLKKAKVSAKCFRAGCSNGRITGAVSSTDLETVFLPELAQLLTLLIAQDCPGPEPDSCASGSTGKSVQEIFDADDDLTVTSAELQDHDLIKAVFAPDLNLLTGDGGVNDHLSFGFGFSTVKAKLTRP